MPLDSFTAPRRAGPLSSVAELLFPSRCLGCGQRGVLLCAGCAPSVPWLAAATCPRCARDSLDGRLCRSCQGGRLRELASVRAACQYEGAIRTAIHNLKYRHARFLASFLARVLAETVARRPLEADLVIPVPLAPRRHRERGYNQSELIAAELAQVSRLPAPSVGLLEKPRDTRPQVGLSAPKRRRNLWGAFVCLRPEAVAGRRCLLVDDVMTTGATLESCAEPLHRAGAARVMGLVVARD